MTTGATSEISPPEPAGNPPEVSPARPAAAYAASLLLLVFAACISIGQITDDDVFWHLATGRWIAVHHSVPSADVFGYVTAGQPWIPFEWGWDLLIYTLYSAGGYLLMQTLPALLSCGIVFFLLAAMRRLGIPLPVVIFVLLLTFLATMFGIQDRPYTISLFFFAALLWLLISYRYDPRAAVRRLYLLPPIFVLWANMHPGVIGGILLLATALAVETAEFLFPRLRGSGDPAVRRKPRPLFLAGIVIACTAALLVNPHGIDTYLYVYRHIHLRLLAQVVEWLPPLSADFESRTILIYKLLLILGASSLAASVRRKDIFPSVLYAVFALYSLRGVRFTSDFAVVTAAGTALGLTAFAGLLPAAARFLRRGAALAAVILLTAVLIVMAADDELYKDLRYHRHTGFGPDRHYFSAGLIDFMRNQGISGRPFNSNEIGGQLVWEFPEGKNFIDSRNLGDSIWDEYYAIMARTPGFERKLAGYGVDFIVLSLQDLVSSPRSMLGTPIPFCEEHPADWRLVYWDDRTFLYLKTVPKFDACCTAMGYAVLDPYRYAFAFRQFDSIAVTAPDIFRAELKRRLAEDPGGFLTRSFREYGRLRKLTE